jgi:multidrug efflux system outer membrane protein
LSPIVQRASVAVVLLGAAACAVGPDYVAPEPKPPDAWHMQVTDGLADGEADLQTWWTLLEDETLTHLIDRAFGGNYDVLQAAARVRTARAGLGVAKGERVPEVGGAGQVQRSRISSNLLGVDTSAQTSYGFGIDASWELDLWGRVRRAVESAGADYEASVEAYRDTLVVLFADVATSYVDVRTAQAQLKAARGNVEIQRESLKLSRERREAGLVGDLDLRQAELNLARTEAFIPPQVQREAESIHRLGVLLGLQPSALYEELRTEREIPQPPPQLAIGLPADLLRQRPDIRQAERRLAAQTARIGVATADLYPRFSISGSFSFDATDAADLLKWDSRTFGIGPRMQWNIFAGGRISATITAEEARTEEALGAYEETVLSSYEEVENALVAFEQEQRRRDALERSVIAARDGVRLVNVVYRQGLTQFQNVLDTEQLLFEQEDQLASSQGQVVRNLIRLYKALGGGWAP